MASTRRGDGVNAKLDSDVVADVELLHDIPAPVAPGLLSAAGEPVSSPEISEGSVTKAGRGAAAVAVTLSLLVALGAWQVVGQADAASARPERPLTDVLARQSPSPTVRWETPPKFGGRGGDYSQVTVPSAVSPGPNALGDFRPGPYR